MTDMDDATAAVAAQSQWGMNRGDQAIAALLRAAIAARRTVLDHEARIAALETEVASLTTQLEALLPPPPSA